MNENFSARLNQIKINQSDFSIDEANTKQHAILPILDILGWQVYDTKEVILEHRVEGGKVDYSLRLQGQNKVFLEAKKASEDLEKHEEQLLRYSFREGVKLAILTNGITWWFYLPLETGSWEQRKFFTVDLNEQPIEDCIEKFQNLLSRDNVESGNAYRNAKLLYEGRQRNKIIKENLPKAWQKLISEPDEMLVELLNETLEKICGYKAEENQIADFLHQIFSSPNISPQIQKISLREKNIIPNIQNKITEDLIRLDSNLLDNLHFTKIIDGRFANNTATRWRSLLNIGLKMAFDREIKMEILQNELKANFKEGKHKEDGFSFVEGTNFSLQGQDANATANNTLKLAKLLNCEIYVLFEWREKGKFPMKQGLVHWKP